MEQFNKFQFVEQMKTAASVMEAAVLFHTPMRAVYWIAIWWPCATRLALWNVRSRMGQFFLTIWPPTEPASREVR